MREIKDNAYMFSLSRENYARIIISRTDRGDICTGDNVFNVLGISQNDEEYFNDMLERLSSAHIALLGKRGGIKRAVLFFRSFSFSSHICLAVELELPVRDASSLLCSGAMGDILVSKSLRKFDDGESLMSLERQSAYLYISKIMGELSIVLGIHLSSNADSPSDICLCAESAADFVGVRLDKDIVYDNGAKVDHLYGNIFSGGFCFAALLVIAMAAREYSKDRRFYLKAVRKFGNTLIYINFSGVEHNDTWAEQLEIHANIFNVSFCRCSDRSEYELIPYYSDVAVVGVKEDAYEFLLKRRFTVYVVESCRYID